MDLRVAQLQLRQLHLRLGRRLLILRGLVVGHGGIQVNLADGVHRGQRADARQIRAGLDQGRAGLGQHRLGLGNLGLEGLRIDGVQQGALLDEGAFLEMDTFKETVHPGTDGHIDGTDGLAHHIEGDAYVLGGDSDERDVRHCDCRGRFVATARQHAQQEG